MSGLAFRLAARDLGRTGRGLWLLVTCLFLGAAALGGIGSLSTSIVAALADQGRQALGGDLEMHVSQRRATVAEQAAFAARGPVSETLRLRGMLSAGGATALVDLKAVDARWPLIGRLQLAPGALAPRPSGLDAAIAPALADRLRVRVGDTVTLGAARLRVIGLIADEPDRLGEGFRLGLPVIVPLAALDAAGLIQPGSLYDARYRMLLGAGHAAPTGAALARGFPSAGWSVRTADDATRSLRRGIDQLGQFLLLAGLAALAIACVGVASGVSARLAAKTGTIATLKVLGARSGTIAAMLAAELGIAALIGIGAGLALGAAVPALVAGLAGDALPVPPRIALYPQPLGVAGALALIAATVAALPALARARNVPAATLLRGRLATSPRPSIRVLAAMAMLAIAGAAIAILGASDRMLAAGFLAGSVVLIGLLALIGRAIRWGVARLPRPRRPLLRLALANLHRPGAPTDRLVVALGLGFSLFVALAVVNGGLAAELASAAPAKAPRFFAIDLQPQDEARFRAAIGRAAAGARIEAVPSLRGTVVALGGRRVADMRQLPPDAWILRGDRTITWSATLPPRNRVTAGRWWPADYRGPPLVSIGEDAARTLGLRVGDRMTIAVLGVEVPARIAALRAIDWGGLGLNFAIVFSPGYIEEAPHALLASVYAPPGRDGAIARAVAAAVPSTTMIRVGDVIAQIGDVVGQIAFAIRAAAGVTIAAGIVVLLGAIAATTRERAGDAVLLKLLGATRAQLLLANAIEYGLLSLALALVAVAVGGPAGWYVVTQVFDLGFVVDWRGITLTLALAVGAVVGVGLLGTLPILRVRPAEALRAG